jgi:hypothetical protein
LWASWEGGSYGDQGLGGWERKFDDLHGGEGEQSHVGELLVTNDDQVDSTPEKKIINVRKVGRAVDLWDSTKPPRPAWLFL